MGNLKRGFEACFEQKWAQNLKPRFEAFDVKKYHVTMPDEASHFAKRVDVSLRAATQTSFLRLGALVKFSDCVCCVNVETGYVVTLIWFHYTINSAHAVD